MTDPVEVLPNGRRCKLVFGIPVSDPLDAARVEAMLKPLFPSHDIVILGGFSGMMEVRA